MRKNILSTLAIMGGCILLLSSCEKREDGLVIDNTKGGKIFTAVMPTVEEITESKTSTADGKSVIWNEGDMISLFNGKNVNEKYRVQEGKGGKASTTLVKVTDSDSPAGSDATFDASIAYYPYGTVSYTGTGSNHALEVTIPNTQTYAPNTFGKGTLPMVAVTASKDDDNLQFKNLFGLIKLQLKGSDGVDKITGITIKGNSREKLSGKATVNCSNTEAPTVSFGESDVYGYIRLDCAEGVVINEESATSFWIALRPTTFNKGITITVDFGDGRTVTESTNRALTIERSKITPMSVLTLVDGSEELDVPDPAFRAYLLEKADMDNDGVLTLNDAKAWNKSTRWKSFDVISKNITSLKGIEYFTALERLYCSYNKLSTLDVSKNTALKELECWDNQLTSLDANNCTALTSLSCSNNQLTSLDVRSCTALTSLSCYNNQLTSLDVRSCTALTSLSCSNNQLTSLDVSNCTALICLRCYDNQLTTLDLSKNTALEELECYDNQLTSLEVSKGTALTELNCNDNKLTTLDVSNCTALTTLWCLGNQLTTLDVSNCTALTTLYCRDNQLNTLDVSNLTALTTLWCSGNQLTTLDVSNCTALTALWCYDNQLTTLDVSNFTALTSLWCWDNQFTSLDVSRNTNLTSLMCYDNQLTTLDVSNLTALTTLWCWDNQFTTLDVSRNTNLTNLKCYDNQLTSLNVSNCTSLTWLDCGNNRLNSLDLSKNTALTTLYCNMSTLKTLYLKTGRVINGINNSRSEERIHPDTVIEYKD